MENLRKDNSKDKDAQEAHQLKLKVSRVKLALLMSACMGMAFELDVHIMFNAFSCKYPVSSIIVNSKVVSKTY